MGVFKIAKSLLTRGVLGTVIAEGGQFAGKKALEHQVKKVVKNKAVPVFVKWGLMAEPEPEKTTLQKLLDKKDNLQNKVLKKGLSLRHILEEAGKKGQEQAIVEPVVEEQDNTDPAMTKNNKKKMSR